MLIKDQDLWRVRGGRRVEQGTKSSCRCKPVRVLTNIIGDLEYGQPGRVARVLTWKSELSSSISSLMHKPWVRCGLGKSTFVVEMLISQMLSYFFSSTLLTGPCDSSHSSCELSCCMALPSWSSAFICLTLPRSFLPCSIVIAIF